MIQPYSLVQLTDAGVVEILDQRKEILTAIVGAENIEDPENETPALRRKRLRAARDHIHPLFNHPGIMFLHAQSDEPHLGVFATHDQDVYWGFELSSFEPYNEYDHL